jgi:hypothetical protein
MKALQEGKMNWMRSFGVMVFGFLLTGMMTVQVWAGDLDDDISKYKDDSVKEYDNLGKPDTNISFIVSDALGKAKVWEYQMQKENVVKEPGEVKKDAKAEKKKQNKRKRDKGNINMNDGSGDSNENSIVIGTGAEVLGPIINVNVEK